MGENLTGEERLEDDPRCEKASGDRARDFYDKINNVYCGNHRINASRMVVFSDRCNDGYYWVGCSQCKNFFIVELEEEKEDDRWKDDDRLRTELELSEVPKEGG